MMKTTLRILPVILGIATCFTFSTTARAGELDKKTVLTFNQPVEVPGMVLQAGTYVIRRMDGANPNVIQILNGDETHVYATLLTIPDYKMDSSDASVVTLEERSAESPQAIKEWFYPGDTIGQEFLYPAAKASTREAPSAR